MKINAIPIKVVNKGRHPLPAYSTPLSAGMDIRALLEETLILKPMDRALIGTGLYLELPPGIEIQIRPRSGLALKKGMTVLNSPGTIDADYRGEIKVLMINLSTEHQTIEDGDRIAQMIIAQHSTVEWQEVDSLSETTRGAGGYGHTGEK